MNIFSKMEVAPKKNTFPAFTVKFIQIESLAEKIYAIVRLIHKEQIKGK